MDSKKVPFLPCVFSRRLLLSASLLTMMPIACWSQAGVGTTPDPSRNNVEWKTLGSSEKDSMPIGNGDLATNVWTEKNGDLVLLIAKSDAWSELAKLDKLARIRIHLSSNPFANAGDFTQTLHIENARVAIASGPNHLTIWTDANRPVLHIIGNLVYPSQVEASLELWRTQTHSFNEPSPDRGGLFGLGELGPKSHPIPIPFSADTILSASVNRLTWYHFNPDSIYPTVLYQEHLEQFGNKYPDPLLHRCFGTTLKGAGMIAKDDHTLASLRPEKTFSVSLLALTTTPPDWQQLLDELPELPTGTTHNGKLPPFGRGDPDGKRELLTPNSIRSFRTAYSVWASLSCSWHATPMPRDSFR